jgi:hypothetical protein
VGVAALVGGDHHAAVLRQPFHTLLHAAVGVGAPVVAPARTHTHEKPGWSENITNDLL